MDADNNGTVSTPELKGFLAKVGAPADEIDGIIADVSLPA
jgi:hypothetical protein